MINTSTTFRTELLKDSKPWKVKIELDLEDTAEVNLAVSQGDIAVSQGEIMVKPYKQTVTVTNPQLWKGSISFDDAVSSDGIFEVGSAIINSFSFTLDNYNGEWDNYDFTDAVCRPYVGLVLPNSTTEYVRKGVYIVDNTAYNGATIKITALDRMSLLDKPYDTNLSYPATLSTILNDICSKCGVTLAAGSSNFPHRDFLVAEKPSSESNTYRQVLASVAQIAGRYARFNNQGYLQLGWYDTSAFADNSDVQGVVAESGKTACVVDVTGLTSSSTFIYNANFSHSVCIDDTVITGVRVAYHIPNDSSENADGVCLSGYEGLVIGIQDNPLIQSAEGAQNIANWLGAELVGLSYRVASCGHLPDPTIEAGDVGFLIDRKGNIFKFIFSGTNFKVGATQNSRSSGETPTKNSASRYTSMTRNYVRLKEIIASTKDYYEAGLDELDQALGEKSGLYTTEEVLEDNSRIFYMHDQPELANSTIVWKMNEEAWGVSTDGGETWNGGMTVNGDVIARYLSADGVNANWINVGTIRDQTNTNYWNLETGEFHLQGVPSAAEIQEIKDDLTQMETDLTEQIDSKIDTWYQTTDPSTAWTTTELKNSHEGDLWYNSSTNTTWRWSGTTWEEQEVSDAVFDAIDGKSTIYYGSPTGTYTGVNTGDFLVDPETGTSYRWTGQEWVTVQDYQSVLDSVYGIFDILKSGSDPVVATAQVIKNGENVTNSYPASWYTWYKTNGTSNEETYIGTGYSITVDPDDFQYGGVLIGYFTIYETTNLMVSGDTLAVSEGDLDIAIVL